MIEYNESKRIIHLTNGKISYFIYVNSAGYPETLYFGMAMRDIGEIGALRENAEFHDSSFYYDNVEKVEKRYSDRYKFNGAPQEISTHGKGDKRYSPIIIRNVNGSFETDFRYVSHKTYRGIEPVEGMPHASGESCETVEFLLKEVASELYLRYYLTIYDDKDVIIKSFKLINENDFSIDVLRAASLQLDLTRDDYDLVHFRGRWLKEREYVETKLSDGATEISSNYGRSSHEENPFVYLKESGANLTYGEVIGFNLIYSGNFKFRVELGYAGSPHIVYGMNDEDFVWTIESKGEFATPQAVCVYSCEGVEKMSQTFHAFIKENLYSGKKYDYLPILFNSWEGCYFDFTTESVISYIDDACKIGTELFVLDDGWFGARNSDNAGLGDWRVNESKVDLHKVIAHCKEKGIKFGIWFEPEMINYDSDLFRAHPEYVLGDGTANELTCIRHQFHLDLTNEEVIENVYAQLKKFFEEYPVDYIKWDYNRVVCEHYSRLLGVKQGEVYHRLTLGYYKLLSAIKNDFPDMMIEGCASGGGRFDLGTLYYVPQIWASDESDPAQRMEINYNTSLGYPLSTIGAHVNANPITCYKTKAIMALFGTYGYEINPNRLTEPEKAELSEIADVYRKYHKKVIEDGVLYHILSPNEGNFMCMQAVSKDKNDSLVVIINRKKELDRFRYVRLKGLDKNAEYFNDYENCAHSGEYYMNVGINYSREWLDEFTCKLIKLEKVNKKA